MKILIDARFYGLENAGIGRYLNNLLDYLAKIDKKNQYILLLRKNYFSSLELSPNFKKVLADFPHYSLNEQLKLPLIIRKEKPDLVHFPHFNVPIFWPGKYVVTIHDLIKHTSKGMATTTRNSWFYWLKYLGYKVIFKQAVKRAAKILVPSQTVKQELIKTYNIPENKIAVTYEGVDDKFQQSVISNQRSVAKAMARPSQPLRRRRQRRRQSAGILAKYRIKKPFVIYTGSVYPHKNIERLIEAIICLNDLNHLNKKLFLVIVCARSVFYQRLEKKLQKFGARGLINLVGFVPDNELAVLYKEAEAFIFPTLSEGFGLPGLEAMSVGLPVVCSDIPVLREVYSEAALYFNPLDVSDVVQKIKEVCFDDLNLRGRIKETGLAQVEKYSWKKMAQETLAVYEELKQERR